MKDGLPQRLTGKLVVIGTPIGNLSDITIRALDALKSLDILYCEDTRRTLKLLNRFEIKKPLKSCPYYREKGVSEQIVEEIKNGRVVGMVTDAGMPGLSDPGSWIVHQVRRAGLEVEVVGGLSSLTQFIAGSGYDFEVFRFVGFLPARLKDRQKFFLESSTTTTIFFESPHRLRSTLELLQTLRPTASLVFAKELTKISERYFFGSASDILHQLESEKGEWIGAIMEDSLK